MALGARLHVDVSAVGGPLVLEDDMKDVLSLTVFAGKVLCLVMFVPGPKSANIGAVRTLAKPANCKIARSGLPGCGLTLLAAASAADVRPCNAHPPFAHC